MTKDIYQQKEQIYNVTQSSLAPYNTQKKYATRTESYQSSQRAGQTQQLRPCCNRGCFTCPFR